MKQVFILLSFVFCTVFAANAQSEHTSIMFKHHTTPNPTEMASITSLAAMPHQAGLAEMSVGGERASRRYENAAKKQKAGIVLTAIGGTFLIGGSALLAVGAIGIKNDINTGGTYNGGYSYSPLTHTVEIAFGTILALAGTGMTIPGAIILAKATKDKKKYKASQEVN